jgi:hypothetical protein
MEVIAIELTEEELAEVLRKREEAATKEKAVALFNEITERLQAIADLGYHVRGKRIGGSYVPIHEPDFCPTTVRLTKW